MAQVPVSWLVAVAVVMLLSPRVVASAVPTPSRRKADLSPVLFPGCPNCPGAAVSDQHNPDNRGTAYHYGEDSSDRGEGPSWLRRPRFRPVLNRLDNGHDQQCDGDVDHPSAAMHVRFQDRGIRQSMVVQPCAGGGG